MALKKRRPPSNPDLIDVARSHLDIGADPHTVLDLVLDAAIRLVDKLPPTTRKAHAVSDHISRLMDRLNGLTTDNTLAHGSPAAGVIERHPVPKLKP